MAVFAPGWLGEFGGDSAPAHPPMMFRPLLPLLAGLALLAGPSCTGWPRGWSQAQRHPAPDGLSGAWEGTWRSLPSGHSGKLRCAVFPKAPGIWEYRYRATWAQIFCAGFTVDCAAEPQADGAWRVVGSRDLGPAFGGTFTHQGRVSGDTLEARYHAAADHGLLTLQRRPSPIAPAPRPTP